jgi:hypothetical protein
MEAGFEAVPDLGVARGFVVIVEDICVGGFLIGVLFAAEAVPDGLVGASAASFLGAAEEAVLAGLFDGASFFGVVAFKEAVLVNLEEVPVGFAGGFCTDCFIGVAGFLLAEAGFVALDAAVEEDGAFFVAGLEGIAVVLGLIGFAAAAGGAEDATGFFVAAAIGFFPNVVVVCPLAGPVPETGVFAVVALGTGSACCH